MTSVPPASSPTCNNADSDEYAVYFCATQGIYTAQNALVLAYGQILTVSNVSCVSREGASRACS
ncbi:hypothetical protein [Rhodococcoides kroppenstedtii]|uniref:hypothetical protein n=1 Tax=Rhodococcoides kroppenstedtii TaxID=293050 RepID=UPI00363DD897